MSEAIAQESLKRLPSEIASWLLQQIQAGNLAPGDQLPSERQLCEQFSVSRPVVREALSRLKSEGLIVTQQGRGAFVAEKVERQSFRLQDVALSEKAAQAHILELLATIEVAATRLAAQRRTEADLKKIRRGLIGLQYAILNDQLGDEEDYAFHHAIVDATQNPHFIALSEYLEHSVRRLIRQARSNTAARYAHLIQDVQNEHQAIFNAIAAGDPDAAATAAETHLRNVGKRLKIYRGKANGNVRGNGAASAAAAKSKARLRATRATA